MSTIEQTIKQQNDFCGLTDFLSRSKGTKKRRVWNTEGYGKRDEHAEIASKRVWHASPGREIIASDLENEYSNDKVKKCGTFYNGRWWDAEEFIVEHNIGVVTRSIGGGQASGGAYSDLWNGIKKRRNVIVVNSGGNLDKDGDVAGGSFPIDVALFISSLSLTDRGRIIKSPWSAEGACIDFGDFAGIWNGTSFSGPYVAGKAAELQDFYDVNMDQEEMTRLFIMLAKDFLDPGIDDACGHGMIMMPKRNQRYITMTPGEKKFFIDGESREMDCAPVNKVLNGMGTVFVPIRFIGETFGKTFEYEAISNGVVHVKMKHGTNLIEFRTGFPYIWKNGTKYTLDFAPYIESGRTMVPIRKLTEFMDCKVDWVPHKSRVMVFGEVQI